MNSAYILFTWKPMTYPGANGTPNQFRAFRDLGRLFLRFKGEHWYEIPQKLQEKVM